MKSEKMKKIKDVNKVLVITWMKINEMKEMKLKFFISLIFLKMNRKLLKFSFNDISFHVEKKCTYVEYKNYVITY